MKGRRLYATGRFLVSLVVMFVLVFGDFLSLTPPFIGAPHTNTAEAAQSTVDATASATSTSAIHGPPQTVFTSDTAGYRFYRDQNGSCVYAKTTDSGNTWGTAVTVFSQATCSNVAIWYDQWTPGLTGTKVHIVMMNFGANKLFYNVLDTSNDTLGDGTTGTTTDPSNIQTGSFNEGANYPAISEAANGNLYVGIVDNNDSYVLRCTTTCTTAANWSEAGTNPFTLADGDFVLLEPLSTSSIMAINRRQTGQIIQYKTWNTVTWSGAWTAIDGSSLLNTVYDIGMSAVVSSSTGKIYLAWTADNVTLGTDDDIRVGTWNGASWATSTMFLNSARGLTGVALGLNKGNDDLYLVYTGATTPATVSTQNVYWRLAQNGSTTQFGAENGTTVNTGASDLYGIDVNGVSDERIFASWYASTTAVIAGDTIADIAPGIMVTASTSMNGTAFASTTNQYLGGKFAFRETQNSRNITSISVTASGTASATTAFKNVKMFYDQDVSYPYNCDSESYVGTEAQYGSTGSFNASGTIAFSGALAISTTSTMCAYIVTDIASGTSGSSTVDWTITSPPTNVVITGGGTVLPTTTVIIASSTVIRNGDRTLAHYHWRLDDGGQATSSSATNATEDTPWANLSKYINSRVRIEVSNRGSTSTFPSQYRLEYGVKRSTCSAVSTWTQVGPTADIMMYDTYQIANASNTTNIATSTGGTTDDKTTFVTPNGGFMDTSSQTGAITLAPAQFTELEYSVIASTSALDNSSYCFRVTDAGTPLEIYAKYPEATIKLSTDFFVQRGITLIPAAVAGATITAGVDYKAPAASTSAYIRITNTQNTGAGSTAGTASQNANSVTAYISNPSNILNSVTFTHDVAAAGITRIEWEIVEYKGPVGGANEIKVQQQQTVTFGTASTTATSSATGGVINGSSTAVFITGEFTPSAALTAYTTGLATANWASSTHQAVFTRDATGTLAAIVSYAAVEFTGINWKVQRTEHTYTAVNATETNAITPVNSLSQTFIHVQKRTNVNSHASYGHEVWLSSVGQVSFVLDAAATLPAQHTSVAWVIENTQTNGNSMAVTRSNGTQTGGAAPLTLLVNIGKTITDVTNASIFANNRDSAALATWPEPIMGVRLTATSTTQYEFWLSNTGDSRGYRTEVVEWPTAQRELTQDYYQIYANSDTLKPTSGWPVGSPTPLGENTAMTGFNQPMNTGDVARIRMSLKVSGSSGVPQGDTYFLQYANRASSTCSAISTWSDVGSAASTTALWRGFTNPSVTNQTPLSTDPPTGGGLVLSVSDRAATYESNGGQSTTTPYAAVSGDDIEFDWVVQDSLAASRASYCFRMVRSDKTPLTAYNFYPTLKTIGYGVESKKWRWYDDAQNATPTTTLAAETVTPINISYNNAIALRLTLRESQGATGSNIKFKLQYSESPTFSVVSDVVATTTCTDGVSLWCYAELGGTDNTTIASSTLSDADSCIAGVGRGCGMYNTSPLSSSTLSQQATSSAEFSFTIRNAGARVNRTYYFRAWDMQNNEAVAAASGESYPSLTTEGSSLNFAVSGIATSTVVGGVAMDVATTPTSIPFGSFTGSSTKNAAYQLSVDTDATQGYQVFVYQTQNLLSSNGGTILPVTGTNAVPGGWATVCPTSQASCFGYHTIDATLAGGSARFAPNDTYAALTTTPGEVAQYSAPITGDAVTVVYRVTTRTSQSSGAFSTSLVYLVVPVF